MYSYLAHLRIVFFASLITWSAISAASSYEMLDRMSHSFRELNYRGTFSYQQGGNTESFRLVHAVIGGEEYERLEYLDGEKRQIVRRGHDLKCVHPGHQLVRFYQHGKGFQMTTEKGGSISDYYQIEQLDSGRVAGRSVINLSISPKDTHRFGYRLSLDEESGLLLRTELIGPQDKVLERFQFVEITIGGQIDRSEFPDTTDGSSHDADHVAPTVGQDNSSVTRSRSAWRVKWLPAGFTSTIANMDAVTDDMATFTDGLTVFSVFIEDKLDQQTIAKGIEGSAQRGATTAYSRALLLAGQPHRVTVVGEIPSLTAQKIAQSITLVNSGTN